MIGPSGAHVAHQRIESYALISNSIITKQPRIYVSIHLYVTTLTLIFIKLIPTAHARTYFLQVDESRRDRKKKKPPSAPLRPPRELGPGGDTLEVTFRSDRERDVEAYEDFYDQADGRRPRRRRR